LRRTAVCVRVREQVLLSCRVFGWGRRIAARGMVEILHSGIQKSRTRAFEFTRDSLFIRCHHTKKTRENCDKKWQWD
jgi:hypothetical protein